MTDSIIDTHYGTAADIQAILDKAEKGVKDLSVEEQIKIAKEAPEFFVAFILTGVVPQLTQLVSLLNTAFPNRQCQCALMDIEGLRLNMADLAEHGPKEPFTDIPLEASEVQDTSVPEGWEGSSASSN